MPIYEYACSCGKTFEVMVLRRSDEEEVRCPDCQGTEVERVLSHTAPSRPRWKMKEPRRAKKMR